LAARRSVRGDDLHFGDGVRGRIYGILAWTVGRADFPV
jgi:hypothetical protein